MKVPTSTAGAVAALLLAAIRTTKAETTAANIIHEMMPNSVTCTADSIECRTANEAAPYLVKAFQEYGIFHAAEIAAILTTIGTESGDLAWKTNQFPGRAGQGSSNMQMYPFNYEFAQSMPALKAKVDAIQGAGDPSPSNETMNAVLALIIEDEYNWMTGPWYYSTKCTKAQKAAFTEEIDLDAAFTEYTLKCIGLGQIETARETRWANAKAAFDM